jgi:hypothetical protein
MPSQSSPPPPPLSKVACRACVSKTHNLLCGNLDINLTLYNKREMVVNEMGTKFWHL